MRGDLRPVLPSVDPSPLPTVSSEGGGHLRRTIVRAWFDASPSAVGGCRIEPRPGSLDRLRFRARGAGATGRRLHVAPVSWVHSGHWRRPGRSQSIRRLGVNRYEESLFGAREQPVDNAFIRPSRAAHEPILAMIEAFDFEFLPRFYVVLSSQLGGQHDLPLRGHCRLHEV